MILYALYGPPFFSRATLHMEYYRSYSMIVSADARVLKFGLQSDFEGVSMCLSDNNLKLNVGKTQLLSWGAGKGCGSWSSSCKEGGVGGGGGGGGSESSEKRKGEEPGSLDG